MVGTLDTAESKTGVEYVVMLDDTCMEILSRNSNALPKMNNSDYNTAEGVRHGSRHSQAVALTSGQAYLCHLYAEPQGRYYQRVKGSWA